MSRSTRRITGSGFVLTREEMGHGLESHLTEWGNQGSNYGPMCTRRVVYPLHQGGSPGSVRESK